MSFYYIPSSGIDISQVADGFDRFLYSPRPDKDAAKSLSFAKMAAEQGHADAEFRMVQMCFDGPSIGLPLDVGSGVLQTLQVIHMPVWLGLALAG